MSEQQQLSQAEIVQMNDMASFFSFKYVPINKWFFSIPHKIICSFTGNQFGKTAMMTYSVVLSMMGRHPGEEPGLLQVRLRRDVEPPQGAERWQMPQMRGNNHVVQQLRPHHTVRVGDVAGGFRGREGATQHGDEEHPVS
jgi:hypothetical protein